MNQSPLKFPTRYRQRCYSRQRMRFFKSLALATLAKSRGASGKGKVR